MQDSLGLKAWGVISAFLAIAGFVSGFSLSNGLTQQEHKLMNYLIEENKNQNLLQDQKIDKVLEKISAIQAKPPEVYLDE